MHYSVWQQICDTYFVHVKKKEYKNIFIFLYSSQKRIYKVRIGIAFVRREN